jgi:hypothetical protein
MTTSELRALLDAVPDTGEVVLRRRVDPPAWLVDELFVAWSAARAEANLAYDAWCDQHGADAYAVYRAAEDRADAAEAALCATASGRSAD